MRPSSYNSSSSYYNSSSYSPYGSSNYTTSATSPWTPRTSSQLRSTMSSSSTSSYVSRTHLPFVPQSTLVAHCFTGVQSSTRPYGYSSTSNSPSSSSSAASYNYSRSANYMSASRPSGVRSGYTSAYTSSMSRQDSMKRSSYTPTSRSNYNDYSLEFSSSYNGRSSSAAPIHTSSYLSPTTYSTSASSSASRSTHRTRPLTPSSYTYRPIRLRERPILTHIWHQLNSRSGYQTPSSRVTTPVEVDSQHSISKDSGEVHHEDKSLQNEEISAQEEQTSTDDKTQTTGTTQTSLALPNRDQRNDDWSSDLTRAISRNKYIIKFREFDRRQSKDQQTQNAKQLAIAGVPETIAEPVIESESEADSKDEHVEPTVPIVISQPTESQEEPNICSSIDDNAVTTVAISDKEMLNSAKIITESNSSTETKLYSEFLGCQVSIDNQESASKTISNQMLIDPVEIEETRIKDEQPNIETEQMKDLASDASFCSLAAPKELIKPNQQQQVIEAKLNIRIPIKLKGEAEAEAKKLALETLKESGPIETRAEIQKAPNVVDNAEVKIISAKPSGENDNLTNDSTMINKRTKLSDQKPLVELDNIKQKPQIIQSSSTSIKTGVATKPQEQQELIMIKPKEEPQPPVTTEPVRKVLKRNKDSAKSVKGDEKVLIQSQSTASSNQVNTNTSQTCRTEVSGDKCSGTQAEKQASSETKNFKLKLKAVKMKPDQPQVVTDGTGTSKSEGDTDSVITTITSPNASLPELKTLESAKAKTKVRKVMKRKQSNVAIDDAPIEGQVERMHPTSPPVVVADKDRDQMKSSLSLIETSSSDKSNETELKAASSDINPGDKLTENHNTDPLIIPSAKLEGEVIGPRTKASISEQQQLQQTKAQQPPQRIRFREYNIDDFNFLSVLGHGGWGFVILAELKQHEACFAVKCIKKITIVEDDDYESILIERKVLALGNINPFICKLFCTFETPGYLFFVMEFCPGGDLMFHVQREGKFSEPRCRFYAAEIICAIRFLHNRHIIYRDLKLDNILLDSFGHIRLVDFGMCQCRTYREEMLPSNFCGTPEYISPEIIKGVPYNHSVDWWSFGVLLYEMAVGKMPFRGNDENELLWNVCYEQIHYPLFLSRELTILLQQLLEREPTKRMGMASCKAGDIKDQAWFKGTDWTSIESMKVKPPFVPCVESKRDVQNFDADFTESQPELSPVDDETLARIDQKQFEKFPYTNPDIHIFDSI